jgi:hypothetical protein
MDNIISLKYTKNVDYFIVILLPYIEDFLKDYPKIIINFYSQSPELCGILSLMFGDRVNTHKIQIIHYITNPNVYELDIFIKKYYDVSNIKRISRPLNLSEHNAKYKLNNIICMFPKFDINDAKNSMNMSDLNNFVENNKLVKDHIYFIGDPRERVNTHFGNDVIDFIDIVDVLRNCNIFITTKSYWYHIALICNCRNIILYTRDPNIISHYTNKIDDHKNTDEIKDAIIKFNPFNCNIVVTSNLCDGEVIEFIRKQISKK